MKTHRLLLAVLLTITFFTSFAQEGKIRRSDKDYNKFAYIKTSEILLEVANKGYRSVELFKKLGNSYYFNNKMEDAVKWYRALIVMEETIDPEYYYRYAQALKTIENYTESDKWMQKFHELKSEDTRGRAFVSKVDYLKKIEEISREDMQIKNLEINSEQSDFGSVHYKDQLIFASTRRSGKLYKWNEQPYLDLYVAKKQTDSSYANVFQLSDAINTKYHESSVSFMPNDSILYFTRNNYYKKKYRSDKTGTNRLKLFRASLQNDGSWGNIQSIHFNSDTYSVAHPTVNIQGNRLYFSSDMPGSIGQSDIYVVSINSDGSLATPQNLGELINTEGQENFPFINEQGDLYFSSNGYPGLGGLDVYVIRNFESKWSNNDTNYVVKNIGRPINSSQDDFAYYENLATKEGYFTSNRSGGKGDDDIYSFTVPECKQLINGLVKDKDTQQIIPGAIVILFDGNGNEIGRQIVGNKAEFMFNIACDTEYLVRGEKATYISDEKRLTTPSTQQELKLELLLDKDEKGIQPGDDLAKVLDIPIIYFDFDKYNIRYDAEVELQKVLAVLNKFPTMKIDIRSHTDCRGSYTYNETLSGNRAKSTRQYLIHKGIDPNRLTAKGYGEHELINYCACEGNEAVYCSEADHQLNRRSEFIIIKM